MRPPTIRSFDEELIVDNFAGGGGASLGIEWALGRSPDIAVNHDPEAVAMHQANHPATRHLCGDVWDVKPREVCGGRPVGLAWFSPDCFPAGTMVLTREGYRAIEQVAVDDEVLTHRGRWRRVTAVMSTTKPLMRLRGHGHPGLLVSAEHPFYVRRNEAPYWEPKRLGAPAWVNAESLGRGSYWATPTRFPDSQPPPIPVYRQRHLARSAELMWLVGRYVADGWTRLTDTRADLVITCGRHEADALRERLGFWKREGARSGDDEMAWHERETATAYQFSMSHRGLVKWLREHFGHGAGDKLIPGWALGMPEDFRRALLDGYLSGDGNTQDHRGIVVMATTVSKALAFGIKALAGSLGHTVGVYVGKRTRGVIQGREVSMRPAWSVRWRPFPSDDHHQTVRDEEAGLEWSPVRDRLNLAVENAEVFNLSVEDDESYVVEGIVVHNCTHHSKAKGGKPRDKSKAEKSRGLAWVVVRWANDVRPRVIILENVEEFQDWGPLTEEGKPDKARKGLTFRRWLGCLRAAGYEVELRQLRAHDYGAPTIRKRLFIIARCDGQPIVWPEATHGPGRAHAHRTAAECIDWEHPTPSIFGRKKPLAEKTMRRIARGIFRFVIGSAQPFIVPLTHQRVNDSAPHGVDQPLRTVTGAHRGELALITPVLAPATHGDNGGRADTRMHSPKEPLRTITTRGAQFHVIAPTLVQTGYGERPGQAPRSLDSELSLPMPTITTGGNKGGGHLGEVRVFLTQYNGQSGAQPLDVPINTVTTKDRFGLVYVHGEPYEIADIGQRMLAPRELYRAQGFPDTFRIDVEVTKTNKRGKVRTGPLTKTAQIRMCGNSVCPPIAAALVAANVAAKRAEVA